VRKIIELDTQTDKYPTVTISSGATSDTITLKIGKAQATVDTIELIDALVIFEPTDKG
jgi:hypothetical protein